MLKQWYILILFWGKIKVFSPIVYLLRYFSKQKFIEKFKDCSFLNLACRWYFIWHISYLASTCFSFMKYKYNSYSPYPQEYIFVNGPFLTVLHYFFVSKLNLGSALLQALQWRFIQFWNHLQFLHWNFSFHIVLIIISY